MTDDSVQYLLIAILAFMFALHGFITHKGDK